MQGSHPVQASLPVPQAHLRDAQAQLMRLYTIRDQLCRLTVQAKLHLLHSTIFPLQQVKGHGLAGGSLDSALLPPQCVAGRNMLKYGLRPISKNGFDSGMPA